MKRIIKIEDVVDNSGTIEEYNTPETIRIYLEDPSYWSDDALIRYEEDGIKGACFIDEIIDQEVLIGEEAFLVEE